VDVFVIIQARAGSTRLPEKVLLPILEKPVLKWVVDRMHLCSEVNHVMVATTDSSQDDSVEKLCGSINIPCFRGSENDVLDRYYQAACFFSAKNNDIIVRITGDCPFIDFAICDDVIKLLKTTGADYASNVSPPSFPDGLDCEAFSFQTLKKAWTQASKNFEREHVTQYIVKNPQLFTIANHTASEDNSEMRWTIDYPDDYRFLSAIAERLGCYDFTYVDVLNLLKNEPSFMDINKNYKRNIGLEISINNEITGEVS